MARLTRETADGQHNKGRHGGRTHGLRCKSQSLTVFDVLSVIINCATRIVKHIFKMSMPIESSELCSEENKLTVVLLFLRRFLQVQH